MSSSESDTESADLDEDQNQVFVNLLEDHKILFNKGQTAAIRESKIKAIKAISETFRENKIMLSEKQVLKKFNNFKQRVKEKSDPKITGNKKIKLSTSQKQFYNLWSDGKNPTLDQVPGGASLGKKRPSEKEANEVIKRLKVTETGISSEAGPSRLRIENEPEEFWGMSLEELQRANAIEGILAARDVRRAATQFMEATNTVSSHPTFFNLPPFTTMLNLDTGTVENSQQ